MEFTARLIMELPEQGGVSARGNNWRKKSWVFETFGQYPRKIKVDAMNATIDNLNFEVGKTYTVSFDIDSREFNERWYTDIRAYAAREAQPGADQPFAQPQPVPTGAPAADPFSGANADPFATTPGVKDEGDDLPF